MTTPEKDTEIEESTTAQSIPPSQPKPLPLFTRNQTIVLVLGVVLLALSNLYDYYRYQYYYKYDDATCHRPPDPIWKKERVGTVKWEECYGPSDFLGTECGYIVVPKDYHDVQAGVAKVALGRVKAVNQPSKGAILFNPGGPGVSGKSFITRYGYLLQTLVGNDYDIVGFDPRGVGDSEPKIQCFTNYAPGGEHTTKPCYTHGTFAYNTVLDRGYEFPLNVSQEELRQVLLPQQRRLYALLKTEMEVCARVMGEELPYVGTTTVARDVAAIAERLDGKNAPINYLGLSSYGSILGQYVVNMFPDRVGRVVLDGIANVSSWTTEPQYLRYRRMLTSAEDAYSAILSKCSEMGSECSLAKFPHEDPQIIKHRLEGFLNDLYYSPMPVPDALRPTIYTSGQAWKYLFSTLKSPYSWSSTAHSLAVAMDGDATGLIDHLDFENYAFDLEGSAIVCNDGPRFEPPSAEDTVDEYVDVFGSVSRFVFAAVMTERDAGCQFWPVTPTERFVGPWNRTLRNPILLISNEVDPTSPVSNGRELEEMLAGSARLIVQKTPAFSVSLPSLCIANHMSAYFTNGTLPDEGSVCAADPPPPPGTEDEEDEWGMFVDTPLSRLGELDSALHLHRERGYLQTSGCR
ncbi:hypothetical protein BXZ70DRAFT_55785 [Cristinia sonorae]|uniref:AB hydrolase-1 domain-containing protein n=1 Tax=Cristinia sonorae TaxID=1940300 RepID=A0A8K0US73_9AGAR|nr:hypothetical protein BXZ70DRAFT_55785 [Cristinia sonorae]